jgi:hypothetical protein
MARGCEHGDDSSVHIKCSEIFSNCVTGCFSRGISRGTAKLVNDLFSQLFGYFVPCLLVG